MRFNRRMVNSKLVHMIKINGRQIACYLRNILPDPPAVPTDLYANTSSPDSSNTTLYYIIGVFEQKMTEEPEDQAGLRGTVEGTITVLYSYRDILNRTEFFDPYLNGSKFYKVGAAVDDQSILITQKVKAESLPESGWVQ